MARKKIGTKNFKSYLAIHELKRLNINAFEEVIKCIHELDQVYKRNLDAFDNMRGYGESDSGTAYLSNAGKAIRDKASIYLALSRFVYPTLSAIAVQELEDDSIENSSISTKEAIEIINSDPFKRATTEKVIEAMTNVENLQSLPIGVKDE